MPATRSIARLNVRLSAELKRTIEEAAAELGQSVTDFTVSTLAQTARKILQERDVTFLSRRDRQIFMNLIDDPHAKPNKALRDAATRYKKQIG